MFEPISDSFTSTPAAAANASVLRSWLAALAAPLGGGAADGGAQRLEEVALLEQVKAACAARQARLSVVFDEEQCEQQRAEGWRRQDVGRGVAEQVALARRESPARGGQHLGLAKALVREMPNALQALASGQISEWTATVVARETACLSSDDRRLVDAQLTGRLPAMSVGQVRREAWAAACRLDPYAAVARHRKAVEERRVSVRPAPDAMTYLTALLPVQDGVAAYAALTTAAGSAAAAGDPRTRGQVMADTLLDRVTGRTAGGHGRGSADTGAAAAGAAAGTVEVCLVMTDTALLADGTEPAMVTTTDASGSNPAADLLPASVARDRVRDAARVFVRRLYTDPSTGQLVAMESTRRRFEGLLRRVLVVRDQACRTPWCDAPVRHGDHIRPHADGGPTSLTNGQGLCERCNQTRNLAGWHAEVVSSGRDGPHTVRTTTPTGRTYDSTAPPLLGRRAG